RNEARLKELEQFLLKSFYEHESFQETIKKINTHLNKLLETLCVRPRLMPPYYKHLIKHQGTERVAADYIAGMTDRFCLGFFDRI
ncbi:MAG: deoxyguanosinetriphosphate triphosphohydrolase, partial [Planctomycetota bacterium]